MYVPSAFEERRREVLHRHMREHPLAVFVVTVGREPVVNHLPLVLEPDAGEHGTLRGHVPRENPVWQALDGVASAVAVFGGPESYVSPSWYPGKQAHGKVVPTWNYAVVHAHGRPRAVVDDVSWLRAHLECLVDGHESSRAVPWKLSDAPRDYAERMMSRLVGIELPIALLVGKWKVSQNRSESDRLGVVAGLESRGDDEALAMAELVSKRGAESPHGD